jgi:polyisoprenoid-binding protein YceI
MTESTTATTPATAITTWNIDPAHTGAEFKVKHMMISHVKGTFRGISGVLKLNEADPSLSTIAATIPLATLATGDEQRDGHLKSPDFFDVEKFPSMTFKSTGVTQSGADTYSVVGDLTIHGVTRPVSFAVSDVSVPSKDPWGNTRIGLTITTRINRKDFGLTWNSALETGGLLVGDEVLVSLDAQFIKA